MLLCTSCHHGVRNNNNAFPKNGGQIVKMFLEENRINFDSFNYKNKNDAVHFRRKKRKIDGINVSIPTDFTNTEFKEYLAKLINKGTFTICNVIVLRLHNQAFPNDKFLHDEFSIFSAQIETKLLIKNDEFKNYVKTTVMKKIMEARTTPPPPPPPPPTTPPLDGGLRSQKGLRPFNPLQRIEENYGEFIIQPISM